jgi:hypothetical protein
VVVPPAALLVPALALPPAVLGLPLLPPLELAMPAVLLGRRSVLLPVSQPPSIKSAINEPKRRMGGE